MQQGLNIEQVKQYNASLRKYKEQSTKLRAEIEFNEKELLRQCAELSSELGIEVTPDNVSSILEDKIKKINNTMEIGNEILNRIRAEENKPMASMNSMDGGSGYTIPGNIGMNTPAGPGYSAGIGVPGGINDIPTNLPPIFGI